MITKAIIEGIDKLDSGVIKYVVRIPIFNGKDGAPGATPGNELKSAIASTVPGIKGTLNVGDAVFVGFEENDYGKPVILGNLIGSDSFVNINASAIAVKDSAILPDNTKIGSIDYNMLYGAVRWWRAYSAGTVPIGTGDIVYVYLQSATGTLDVDTFNSLIDNDLNELVYNNCYYKLGYRDSSTRRYVTSILSGGKVQYIDVNLATREWAHSAVLNEVLQAHISDGSSHLSAGEREYWNDKVTCTLDDTNTEKLILTKNNLL